MKKTEKLDSIYSILKKTYTTFDKTDDPWITHGLSSTPFKSLVSVVLSTMTHTKRVVKACVPLYKKVSTFEELLAMDDEELRQIIKPVAHYNRKTKNIKIMCRQIIEDYQGKIPEDRDELMKLQGVGRKVADIMLNFVFSEPTIAVDTHVFRLLNRLGIVDTKSHEIAAKQINELTSKKYKRHAHEWLIQHGMKVCVARVPKCDLCVIKKSCASFKAKKYIK